MPAIPVSYKAEVVEYQLSNISVLQSMYPLHSELAMMPYSQPIVDALEADPAAAVRAERIEFIHTTSIEQGEMDIIILLPLTRSRIELNLRQPAWLTRAEWEHVRALPPSVEDELVVEYLQETLDLIRHRVGSLLKFKIQAAQAKAQAEAAADIKPDIGGQEGGSISGPVKSCLQRVWFWFPSLSSKEKRRDLITFGEEHLLTGFLLAVFDQPGKPGLLCVEGCGKEVDRYMSRIKSESWSDIPPFQKKVTERLRRPLEQDQRRFQTIVDITDQIPKYGQYNHRGDMSEVKRLMDMWGVGEDFAAVVMNTSST